MAEEAGDREGPTAKRQRQEQSDEEGRENAWARCGVAFRSYVPRDVKLQELKRPQTTVPDMVEEISRRVEVWTSRQQQQDVLSLAPKKAAWDLARDLEPKLEQLSHRLDVAVVKLLQQQQQQQLQHDPKERQRLTQ